MLTLIMTLAAPKSPRDSPQFPRKADRLWLQPLSVLKSKTNQHRHHSDIDSRSSSSRFPSIFIPAREEASLFFRLLNRRYEKASIILTSNKGFADWGEMFGDNVLATVDRLPHNSTTVNIKGESHRLKEKHKAGVLAKNTMPISGYEMAQSGQQKWSNSGH